MKTKLGWYVLYVKNRHEQRVYDLLEEMQLDAFLPMTSTVRQWSDRKKMITIPLFSCYVFVKITSSNDFYHALSVNGAFSYISFGNEYAIIADEQIQKLQLLLATDGITDVSIDKDIPVKGEIRKIEYGPLEGMECEILKVNNLNKIVVRIDSIQKNITATLPVTYLSLPSNSVC